MLVEAVISVNPNFSDFFPSGRSTFFGNLRSNFFSNVFPSVAPWYESTLVRYECHDTLTRYRESVALLEKKQVLE